MTQIEKYLEQIEDASANGALKSFDFLTGFGGSKLLGCLQRLVKVAPADTVYCEIGVFQGLSLVSVSAENPEVPCYGVDNFAFFDAEGQNKNIVLERKEKAKADNLHLIDEDYEDALENFDKHSGGKKMGVYFIDGPHDYRSQLMCLQLALPHLAKGAVILIDDSNYAHVRQANRDFVKTHPEFKLLFETYTDKHPTNMTEEEEAEARNGFWDGLNIIVHDPNDELPYAEPPTVRSRKKYENEHEVHSARFADLSWLAVSAVSHLRPFSPRLFTVEALRILKRVITRPSEDLEKYRILNQFAEGLETRLIRPKSAQGDD